MRAPVPARGPQAEKERRKGRQRGRQKQQSQSQERKPRRGSPRECNRRAFPIYRGPVPGKGRPERSRRDWEPEGWIVSCLGGFWACGPRSPPEGRKQRRREGKEGNGDARSSRARARKGSPGEEARGSATDGLFLYTGAPFPARGARKGAEEIGSRRVGLSLVWVAFGLAGPGPRQRATSREGEKERKATERPEAAKPEPERKPREGSPEEERPEMVQQTGFT